MRTTNNVKAMVWDVVSKADRPITVTETIRTLDDIPSHSIYGAFATLCSDGLITEVPSRAGKTYKRTDLAIQKSRALRLLSENAGHGFKQQQVAQQIGCHPHRAYQVLEELVSEGWINRVGGNKFVHYFYGELKSADSMFQCIQCEKPTLHKRNGKGRIMCVECGKQRRTPR